MNLFISWSGAHSRQVAQAWHDLLQALDCGLHPWTSSQGIAAGRLWWNEVHGALGRTDFGILCITRNTLRSLWVSFEAGALSMAVPDARLCPFLVDVTPDELPDPLRAFQSCAAERNACLRLLQHITTLARPDGEPVDPALLLKRFEAAWPMLERAVAERPDELPAALHPDDHNRLDAQGLDQLLQMHFELSARRLNMVVAEALAAHDHDVARVDFERLSLAAVRQLNQGRLQLAPFSADGTGPLHRFLDQIFPVSELEPRLHRGIALARSCRSSAEVMKVVQDLIGDEQTRLQQRLRERLEAAQRARRARP